MDPKKRTSLLLGVTAVLLAVSAVLNVQAQRRRAEEAEEIKAMKDDLNRLQKDLAALRERAEQKLREVDAGGGDAHVAP